RSCAPAAERPCCAPTVRPSCGEARRLECEAWNARLFYGGSAQPSPTMPHLREQLFGEDSAIHNPDSAHLAILFFDFLQKGAQRGAVGSVVRQNLVCQWKARWGHDQHNYRKAVRGRPISAVPPLSRSPSSRAAPA